MRLLIDNALSPRLADFLCSAGHDAVHIRERIAPSAPDDLVFDLAADENRILISADTDFALILAVRASANPSVILLRHNAPTDPETQASLLVRVLQETSGELEEGCVISVTKERVRLRMLPIS